ncbi:MAG: hypothetical protein M1819_005497 [Sarea resinae]|nr:MAG: hypothetical protein M1819_005497 [Sarea resinae]
MASPLLLEKIALVLEKTRLLEKGQNRIIDLWRNICTGMERQITYEAEQNDYEIPAERIFVPQCKDFMEFTSYKLAQFARLDFVKAEMPKLHKVMQSTKQDIRDLEIFRERVILQQTLEDVLAKRGELIFRTYGEEFVPNLRLEAEALQRTISMLENLNAALQKTLAILDTLGRPQTELDIIRRWALELSCRER